MNSKTDHAARAAEELLNELRALAAEAEKAVAGPPEEQSEQAFDTLRARLASAQERLSNLYSETKEQVSAKARRADQAIRENPYQSLVIAAGVGLVAGLLLARRRD